jgi:hypothetical protein
MDLGQRVRHAIAGVKRAVTPQAKIDPFASAQTPLAATADSDMPKTGLRWKAWAALGFIALVPVYYIAGAISTHRINDSLNYKADDAGPGTSKTIAVIAGLIDREVNETTWSPNTQPFQPAALLRYGGNMVNYQSGMIKALSTLTVEIDSQIGRTRGTSAADPDLGKARQGLSRQPDTWWVDSFWLTSSADEEYRRAMKALRDYNVRVGNGTAVFDVRVDNLQAVLNRTALDIGSSSDALEKQMAAGRKVLIDRRADKLFYFVKGQSYAYFMTLRALREDFKDVIAERRVGPLYEAMLADLATAASMQPWIVQNGSPEAVLMPNHLSTEGFYLLRAHAKLREISDVIAR